MKRVLFRNIFKLMIGLLLIFTLSVQVLASAAYDTANATSFVFSDDGVTVTEGAYTGYKIKGTALSITEAGVYTVSGSCANGTIVVKKNVTGVTLILDGLTLKASATAPITCNKGSGVNIVAAAGSVNHLEDDQYNNDDTYTDEEMYPDIENAVIKCKDGSNVTISGSGTINVTANGKNGVKGGYDLYEDDDDGNATDKLLSTASLTIEEVTLNIVCNVNDGLKADNELNILSGNITVSAADDGIKSDYTLNIGEEGADGPTINVTKACEGIEGAQVNVYSGNIYVNASDDGVNAANGDIAERSEDFAYNQYGGYVYINVTNGDGIDSNGSALLAGGTLEIYAPSQGDGDPIDTEYGCTFSGATVLGVGHAMMMQSYSGTYVTFGGTAGGMGGFGMTGGSGSGIVSADQTIAITDASGNTAYAAKSTAPRTASYVVFASPDLISGGSYTLNGTTATAGSSAGGNMGPGGQGQQPGGPGQRPGDGTEQGEQPGDPQNGTPPDPSVTEAQFLPGDADLDGKVTSKDARLVLRASARLETLEGEAMMNCDLDGNGKLTSAEARMILRASAKLETLTVERPSVPSPGGEQPGDPPDGGAGGTPPEGDPPGEPPEGGNGGGPGGAPGGGSGNVTYDADTSITSAATETGKTYASSTADQSALLISTSDEVTVENATVTKTGDSDGGDNCNFYGQNAAVLVKDGATATITGGTITSDASGANGVFCYGGNGGQNGASGDGTTLIIKDTTITTTGSGSGGIMTTGGGVTKAYNLTVTTSGQSSAAIRTDRGGGTVTVDGGTYTSNGLGSPAIYSTADITVSNATLVSNLSEGVCIEGLNSITLNDCDLTANNTKRNGKATFLDTIMIYQSMSGDAASGTSSFTMTGGSLTSKSGHVFHVTNTNAVISLSGVKITNEDSENVLLSVCDDGWNGGNNTATLNASAQTLSGAILVGDNSTLTLNLSDGSSLTGSIGGSIKNASGETVSTDVGTVNVTLDSTSTWTLTADSYVTSFTGDAANVISNGYTLYVNGTALTGTK